MVKATGLEYPSYIKRYPWLKLGTVHDLGILVPYFDMLNHSEDSNASYYYDPETDSLIVDVIEAWFRKFSDFRKYLLIDYIYYLFFESEILRYSFRTTSLYQLRFKIG